METEMQWMWHVCHGHSLAGKMKSHTELAVYCKAACSKPKENVSLICLIGQIIRKKLVEERYAD